VHLYSLTGIIAQLSASRPEFNFLVFFVLSDEYGYIGSSDTIEIPPKHAKKQLPSFIDPEGFFHQLLASVRGVIYRRCFYRFLAASAGGVIILRC
jgi:hypothetical protein